MLRKNYKIANDKVGATTISLSALEVDILTVLVEQKLYGLEILERINEARSEIEMNQLKIGSLYRNSQTIRKSKFD